MALTEATALAELDAHLQFARMGDLLSAQSGIDAIVEAFPRNVNVLHKAGVVKQMTGQGDAALALLHRALDVFPNFHFTEIEIGNTLRSLGKHGEALPWYEKAAASDPFYVLAYLRVAMLRRELGDAHGSADWLARAQKIDPANQEIAEELAKGLIYLNRRGDAIEALEPVISRPGAREENIVVFMQLLTETGSYQRLLDFVPRLPSAQSPSLRFQIDLLAGHARLALGYNRAAVLDRAARREAGAAWCSPPAVLGALRAAIVDRQPLSLIRLGDGEARFLAHMDPATRRHMSEQESRTMADSIWHNWFGTMLAEADSYDVAMLNSDLLHSIRVSDIIGVPGLERMAKDYQHFGYLGYLDGLIDHIQANDLGRRLTDAFISIQIHGHDPFLADLLKGIDFLGFIGPHADLANRLAAHLGIAGTATYLVPGERRLPRHVTDGTGRHFPDRYHEILRDLIVPRRGNVFLVAAGLLGKIYCARVRELGGIAIDIGSVADAWIGFDTRPGQFAGPVETWRLPDVGAGPSPSE